MATTHRACVDYAGSVKHLALVAASIVFAIFAAACLAQTPRMHRCVGNAGEPVFTDRSCAGLALPDPTHDLAPAASVERGTCATSPEQLRDRVARAFRQHDAIALSGLFLWQGYGSAAAASGLRELATRVREPLLELRIESTLPAWPGPTLRDDRDAEPFAAQRLRIDEPLELLVVTSSGANNTFTNEFRIALTNRSGCWWLERP